MAGSLLLLRRWWVDNIIRLSATKTRRPATRRCRCARGTFMERASGERWAVAQAAAVEAPAAGYRAACAVTWWLWPRLSRGDGIESVEALGREFGRCAGVRQGLASLMPAAAYTGGAAVSNKEQEETAAAREQGLEQRAGTPRHRRRGMQNMLLGAAIVACTVLSTLPRTLTRPIDAQGSARPSPGVGSSCSRRRRAFAASSAPHPSSHGERVCAAAAGRVAAACLHAAAASAAASAAACSPLPARRRLRMSLLLNCPPSA